MNGRFKKRYLIFPVIYLLATVFIFSLYFGGSRNFARPWGTGSFTGRTGESAFGRDRSLAFEVEGLSLAFGKGLSFDGLDGSESQLLVDGFSVRGSDADISFGEQLDLTGSYRNGYYLLEGKLGGPGVLSIPARLPQGISMPLTGVPLVKISSTSYLRLPTGTTLSDDEILLSVPADGSIRLEILVGDERAPLAIWLAQGPTPPTATEHAARVANWVDAAYNGWERTRYQGGRWSFPGGTSRFDETTAMAFFIESLERGNGSLASTRIDQILATNPQGLSYATSPFFDNIVTTHADAGRVLSARAKTLRESLAAGDLDALAASDLLDILVREPDLRILVTNTVRKNGFDTMRSTTIINLFEAFSAYLDGEFPEDFTLDSGPTEALLPRITVTREGYFLRNDRGEIDLVTTLRAGSVILDFESDPTYRSLGRGLVDFALSHADGTGFLPPSPGKAADIAPEVLYQAASPSAFWPSYRYITDGPKGEIWIRGSLADLTIDTRAGYVDLTFTFPVGISHYFAVENLPQITQVTLYGLVWNPDFRFQRFTAGWDETDDTIFAKIRHRVATERFTIRY